MNERRPINTTTVTENCRRAGSTKSEAKAAASRRNGKLGGRPRKIRYQDIQAPPTPRLHDSVQFDSAEQTVSSGEGTDAVLPESA